MAVGAVAAVGAGEAEAVFGSSEAVGAAVGVSDASEAAAGAVAASVAKLGEKGTADEGAGVTAGVSARAAEEGAIAWTPDRPSSFWCRQTSKTTKSRTAPVTAPEIRQIRFERNRFGF